MGGGHTEPRKMPSLFVENVVFLHLGVSGYGELPNQRDTEQLRKRLWSLSLLEMGDRLNIQTGLSILEKIRFQD